MTGGLTAHARALVQFALRLKATSAHYQRLIVSLRKANMTNLPARIGGPLKTSLQTSTGALKSADKALPSAAVRLKKVFTAADVDSFEKLVLKATVAVYQVRAPQRVPLGACVRCV